MSGLLLVTAVEAEAEALRAGLTTGAVTVAAVGVGPAAAAAGTARLLAFAEAAGRPYHGVVSAGIGGGFAGRAPVGTTVLATASIAADLGAESPDGFLTLDELGFGRISTPVDPGLFATLRAALPHVTVGTVLTVSTVTGSAGSARALATRHADAVAEAMEGYGVGCAAAGAGVPFAELRTISNPIGPRDRGAWRIRDAFTALTAAAAALEQTPDREVGDTRGDPDDGDAPDR
ncbi:futalosine hydrolase [Micromonospora sp. NPDC049679]|uniref:futalosine hydrolase n=1 Tax=Micromonospora sp. NPDC049679 TaxID=3155920 RepID=UPI0033DF85EE